MAIADQLLQTVGASARTQCAVPQLTCLRQWSGRLEGCLSEPENLLEACVSGNQAQVHGIVAACSLPPSRERRQRQQEHSGLSQALSGHLKTASHSHARALPLRQQQQQHRSYSCGLAPAALQRLAGIKARHDELCKQLSGEALFSWNAWP